MVGGKKEAGSVRSRTRAGKSPALRSGKVCRPPAVGGSVTAAEGGCRVQLVVPPARTNPCRPSGEGSQIPSPFTAG